MNNLEFYKENGYVVLKKAISDDLTNRYLDAWDKAHKGYFDPYGNNFGWSVESGGDVNEYLNHPEIMEIMCHDSINQFFKELELPVALHRVDTWGTSSQKPWHQDSMLSNPIAYNNYIGAWVAAEDVTMEKGPFQLIPKSHKWKLDKQKIYVGKDQEIVNGRWQNPHLAKAIESHKDEEYFTFLAEKGDVLIWHGNLIHCALDYKPRVLRRAVIGHYTNSLHSEGAKNKSYQEEMKTLLENPNIKMWNGNYLYFDHRTFHYSDN